MAATIVGAPGVRRFEGTAGPDVIITGGARSVNAKAGDDIVCVTGATKFAAGASGNDVVSTSGGLVETFTRLGAGADRFIGGARPDVIGPARGVDAAVDRIDTGGGADRYSDDPAPNNDLVNLGGGRDSANIRAPNLGGSLDGGAGLNSLTMEADFDDPGNWVVDNVAEVATVDGETRFRWDNFRGFSFFRGALTFVASDQSEVVRLFQEFEFRPTTDRLDMRGGDDQVVLSGMVVPVLAGPGTDWVRVVNFADERSRTPAREVSVDLMRDTLLVDDGGVPRPMQIQDVENFEVSGFGTAVLRGDAAGNELVAGQACLAKMYGLGGPDVLRARTNSQCTAHTAEFFGVPRRLVAYGNGGGDLLRGRETADRLFGGRGPDTADGRGGVDVCAAELRFRCE